MRQPFVGLPSFDWLREIVLGLITSSALPDVAGPTTGQLEETSEILRKSALFMLDTLKVYRLVCAVA